MFLMNNYVIKIVT